MGKSDLKHFKVCFKQTGSKVDYKKVITNKVYFKFQFYVNHSHIKVEILKRLKFYGKVEIRRSNNCSKF